MDSVMETRCGLFPCRPGPQVERQFHRVVQHPANDNPTILHPIEQEMPGPTHDATCKSSALPAQTQVPGTDAPTQLRTLNTADPIRLGRDITQRGHDQSLVTLTSHFAKPIMCSGQNVDEIGLRRGR